MSVRDVLARILCKNHHEGDDVFDKRAPYAQKGFLSEADWFINELKEVNQEIGPGWCDDMSLAPKHKEVLIYNAKNYNAIMGIQTTLAEGILTEKELEESDSDEEWLWADNWFGFGVGGADLLEDDLLPTHWRPITPPNGGE